MWELKLTSFLINMYSKWTIDIQKDLLHYLYISCKYNGITFRNTNGGCLIVSKIEKNEPVNCERQIKVRWSFNYLDTIETDDIICDFEKRRDTERCLLKIRQTTTNSRRSCLLFSFSSGWVRWPIINYPKIRCFPPHLYSQWRNMGRLYYFNGCKLFWWLLSRNNGGSECSFVAVF